MTRSRTPFLSSMRTNKPYANSGARRVRRHAEPAIPPVAVYAVALRTLLITEAPSVLSPAKQQLLSDGLDRLATERSPGAPMRRSPAPRRTQGALRSR